MIFAYVRFSTDKQADGDSVERQKSGIETYCRRNALTVDEWLIDEGLSGFKGDHITRGRLGVFIARVEAGEVGAGSTLIVESLDRLGRQDLLTQFSTLTTLMKSGLTVITTIDGKVMTQGSMSSFDGFLIATAKMMTANEESAKKRDRGRSNWQRRRADGKNLAPFAPRWLDENRKVIHERRVVIERIFREVASGLGANKVASRLNADEVPSWAPLRRNGSPLSWHAGSIIHLIRSRSTIGEFQSKTTNEAGETVPVGDPIPNYYEPVITTALFHEANRSMDSRSFRHPIGRRGKDISNLFAKLARCEVCRGPMHYRTAGTYAYLTCSMAARKACSNCKGVNYDRFEAAFLSAVTEFELPGSKPDDAAAQARVAQAEHDLATLEKRVETIAEQLIDVPSEILRRKLAEAEGRLDPARAEVKASLADLREIQEAVAPSERQAQLADLIGQMREGGDVAAIRSSLATAIRKVVDQLIFDDQGNGLVIIMDGLRNYMISAKGRVEAAHAPLDISNDQFSRNDPQRVATIERLRKAA